MGDDLSSTTMALFIYKLDVVIAFDVELEVAFPSGHLVISCLILVIFFHVI